MQSGDGPILVRGLSRSGGTLLVTILDAHPDVAMSYELYPTLLEWTDELPERDLVKGLRKAKLERLGYKVPRSRGLRTYLARCARSGIDHCTFADLLEAHISEGDGLSDLHGRMRFIERCCMAKMRRCGKRVWGLKCNNQYQDYLQIWPNARFINMIRDGRDVLASQLNTGSFNTTPEEVAVGWVNTHTRFCKFQTANPGRAIEVRYEDLTIDPEAQIRRLTEAMGLPFRPTLVDFYTQDLTIYKASHLSLNEVSKPITASKIGRWKKDLSIEQVKAFEAIAGPKLRDLGYGTVTSC
jgi:hypothetical protein